MELLEDWNDELLVNTIAELEPKGESLELVKLRLELRSRRALRRCTGGRRTPRLISERISEFWKYVSKGTEKECWQWNGCRNSDGYGRFPWVRSNLKSSGYAHVFSAIIHGVVVPIGMEVCHECDNPSCVNPKHLFVGTHADNMRDMAKKGRKTKTPRGEASVVSKLTENDVRRIKSMGKMNWLQINSIASELGVSHGAIYPIIRGRTWRHIK